MTLDAHVTGIWCGQMGGGNFRISVDALKHLPVSAILVTMPSVLLSSSAILFMP